MIKIGFNNLSIEYLASREQGRRENYSVFRVYRDETIMFYIYIPDRLLISRSLIERAHFLLNLLHYIYFSFLKMDNLSYLESYMRNLVDTKIEIKGKDIYG